MDIKIFQKFSKFSKKQIFTTIIFSEIIFLLSNYIFIK